MKKAELRDRIEALEEALAVTQKLVAEQATERSFRRAWSLGPVTGYRVPDPADTAKVGDVLPDSWTDFKLNHGCTADDRAYHCTRRPHAAGQHVATVQRSVVHVWPNEADADPLPDGGTHTCPRCLAYVEALPTRRICDECETEVGTRPATYVGMTISGEDAVAHLPDGAVVQWAPSSTAALRTMGKPMAGGSRWPQARGVHPVDTYRIVSLPGDDAVVHAVIHDADCPGGRCSCPGADVERADRDRTAAIEGAATTLDAHARVLSESVGIECRCGWGARPGRRTIAHHARHVAEQLAAVGALGDREPVAARPLLADCHDGEWWPTVGGQYMLRTSPPRSRGYVEETYGPVIERFES